jgi:site-specific DNA-cytosine methylase
VAGKRRGIQVGTRSGLWLEFARLIEESQPDTVIMENVGGLLTLGAARVVMDIVRMGYDVSWFVLSAAECGAPHLRRRFFALGHRRDRSHGWVDQVHPNDECFPFPPGPEDVTGWQQALAHNPAWAPALVVEDFPEQMAREMRVHRIIAAGNAVVPQVAAEVGWRLALSA